MTIQCKYSQIRNDISHQFLQQRKSLSHHLPDKCIKNSNQITKQSLETTGKINPMSSYDHQSITNNSGASSKYPCINIKVNIKQGEPMKQIYENQQHQLLSKRLNKHQSNSQRTIDSTDPYLQGKQSKHSILSTQRTNSISHPYLPKDLILTSVPLRAYTKTLLRTEQSPDYPVLPSSSSAQKIPKIHKFPLITAIKQSRSRTNVYESGLPLKDFFDGAISHRSIMPQPALGEQIVLDSNRRRHEHLYKIIKNQLHEAHVKIEKQYEARKMSQVSPYLQVINNRSIHDTDPLNKSNIVLNQSKEMRERTRSAVKQYLSRVNQLRGLAETNY
ncbi:hypothetical protein FGO68_gene6631 [Halteria grandinella]|uniref:Uncharacterized protein n=1 Tax=Halteria grandinella TaxID=5974 RepID=A0A8J8T1E5_HALGN|nr:hypothetical protein FGO68_gene6631 [Halteria grandinella]